jgi:hypothetical protein
MEQGRELAFVHPALIELVEPHSPDPDALVQFEQVSASLSPFAWVPVQGKKEIVAPVSLRLIAARGFEARAALSSNTFTPSVRNQGPTSAMRSIASVVPSDSQATQVPPSDAAWAAALQRRSAP